ALPPSPLERAEKLEQLRVLEAGHPIAVGIVEEPSVGIDTPEDYRRFVARGRAGGGEAGRGPTRPPGAGPAAGRSRRHRPGAGGGPAAYVLAGAGHEVSLFERAPAVGPVGAGILLQPSGQMALRRLGLLDRVTRDAEPIDELHALTHRGRTLVRLRYDELGP